MTEAKDLLLPSAPPSASSEASEPRRDDAEQGLLNEWYPTWKSLPVEYNVQGVAAGAPWNQDTTVFLHEKYWLLPPKLQMRLLPKGGVRARPTLLGHLRSLVTHLLATIGLLRK